jgi:hypothetical protein
MRVSTIVASFTDHTRVIERRRANYRRWLVALADLAGVRPLFPNLPDGVTPYAFPLVADEAGMVFHGLRMAGIAMWRWEDMAATDCSVSASYRISLLQLPCHQDLSERQMDWMLSSVKAVLAALDT